MHALQKFPADDVQVWTNRHVFLGCHAQWITPESIGEKLPFYDSESEMGITADAIIDNREELFDALQIRKNHHDLPDSQLILKAYQKWGEECVHYLIGDFAFMIWDERSRKLFGARDFSGTRTLYFHKNDRSFSFSTTIQPLLSLPYTSTDFNENWIAEYLAIPGMHDSTDNYSTVYEDIHQIPPSHTIRVKEGKVSFQQYCDITKTEKLKLSSDEEYVEAFQEVYQKAVDARVRTYKKVGAQLSGGLDSGSVCSFAARTLRENGKTLSTFSYVPLQGFDDWTPKSRRADERPWIKSTVDYVGNIKDHYDDFSGRSPLR